jgi:hypothetical protein
MQALSNTLPICNEHLASPSSAPASPTAPSHRHPHLQSPSLVQAELHHLLEGLPPQQPLKAAVAQHSEALPAEGDRVPDSLHQALRTRGGGIHGDAKGGRIATVWSALQPKSRVATRKDMLTKIMNLCTQAKGQKYLAPTSKPCPLCLASIPLNLHIPAVARHPSHQLRHV